MMVDDDHIRCGGALPHPRDEAVVVSRALDSEARLGGRRYIVPERKIFGQIFELGAIAGVGPSRPVANDRQKHVLTHSAVAQQAGAVVGELVEPMETEIVRAPFHTGGGEWNAERTAENGQVFEVDLLLQ